jgi:hypothetical protein
MYLIGTQNNSVRNYLKMNNRVGGGATFGGENFLRTISTIATT